MKALLALALAAQGIPGDEVDKTYAVIDNGDWFVMRGVNECRMLAFYQDDNYFAVEYDARLRNTRLYFQDKSIKALKHGDKRSLKVIFKVNATSNRFDDLWGEHEFTAITIDDKITLIADFDDEMLVDIARYDMIGIFYKDAVVKMRKLGSSAKAVAKLRECAVKQSVENPSDPFG